MIDTFKEIKECQYKGERYSVRDNGAIIRHSRNGMRLRKLDDKWTFGEKDSKDGYKKFVGIGVHRIVATAFLGSPPTSQHVVDHIDTNRCNNRPENLRWVTKLENILQNPITVKRIISACGSVEAFLDNPELLKDNDTDPNFQWMRTVSFEEGQASKKRLQQWAQSDKQPKGNTIGEWVYSRMSTIEEEPESELEKGVMKSLTPNAAEYRVFLDDKPNEYPCTPSEIGENPLKTYKKNLKEGAVFFQAKNGPYIVVKSKLSTDEQSLYVLTKSGYVWVEQDDNHVPKLISNDNDYPDKNIKYSFTVICFRNGWFVHRSERGFLPKEYVEDLYNKST